MDKGTGSGTAILLVVGSIAIVGLGIGVLAGRAGTPAATANGTVVDEGPSAQPIPPVPDAEAPPMASSAPLKPGIEKRANVTWDAKLLESEHNIDAASAHCTLEATIASIDGDNLHLVSNFSVRCGAVTRHEPGGVAPDTVSTLHEVPGVEPGTFRYTIVYWHAGISIDTPHASALIGSSPTARLVIENESRATKVRLLDSTPGFRSTQAGASGFPQDDDEVNGRVIAATGDTAVQPGSFCRIGFHYYGTINGVDRCDVLALCDGTTLIGRPERFSAHCRREGKRVLGAQDLKPQPVDNDPAIDLDEHGAHLWNDIDGARWSVKIALSAQH